MFLKDARTALNMDGLVGSGRGSSGLPEVPARTTVYLGKMARDVLAVRGTCDSLSGRLEQVMRRFHLCRSHGVERLRGTLGDWLLWMHALRDYRGNELLLAGHVAVWVEMYGPQRLALLYEVDAEASMAKLDEASPVSLVSLVEVVEVLWALPEQPATERLLGIGLVDAEEVEGFRRTQKARARKLEALESGQSDMVELLEDKVRLRRKRERLKNAFSPVSSVEGGEDQGEPGDELLEGGSRDYEPGEGDVEVWGDAGAD